jgi:uncharacterized protein YbjT (DUF2867 family)
MSKVLLVVFGATGQQGGSVVDFVISDPDLSQRYRVRGLTRDPAKPAAQALQRKGVEVVRCDLDDAESIAQAVQGAHTLFVMTNTIYDHTTRETETRQGKAAADAAVAAGARYIIWSTVPHAGKLSGGKLQRVSHFDVKAEVEEYIRGLPIKSAFLSPSSFMQNFHTSMAPRPVDGEDVYAITNLLKPSTELPLIDIAGDTGKFVGAILAEPDRYEGVVLAAATALYTLDEIAQAMSEATGKRVVYRQVDDDVLRGFMPSPQFADAMVEMMQLFRDFGYYGPRQRELVEWSAQQARGKLTTLAEYLAKHPLNLQ